MHRPPSAPTQPEHLRRPQLRRDLITELGYAIEIVKKAARACLHEVKDMAG
jgi:hypothetical protein